MRDSMTHGEALAEEKSKALRKMSWDTFRAHRFHSTEFFGVVDSEGEWVDSAVAFDVAAHFACMLDGMHVHKPTEMLEHLRTSKLSIVHSSLLEKMYDAGLLK